MSANPPHRGTNNLKGTSRGSIWPRTQASALVNTIDVNIINHYHHQIHNHFNKKKKKNNNNVIA